MCVCVYGHVYDMQMVPFVLNIYVCVCVHGHMYDLQMGPLLSKIYVYMWSYIFADVTISIKHVYVYMVTRMICIKQMCVRIFVYVQTYDLQMWPLVLKINVCVCLYGHTYDLQMGRFVLNIHVCVYMVTCLMCKWDH